jgi:hypothetical protein
MTVWIYVDTNKQVGDEDHLNKVFADQGAARAVVLASMIGRTPCARALFPEAAGIRGAGNAHPLIEPAPRHGYDRNNHELGGQSCTTLKLAG